MIYLTTSSTYTPQKVFNIALHEDSTNWKLHTILIWKYDQNALSLSFHDDSELLKAFK